MDDSCAVCADALEWVAYGPCGHREVCSTCVARLRFICEDRRCCICKTESDVVFVTKALGDYTRMINDFSVLPSEVKEGRVGAYWYHEDTQAFFDDVDHYKMIKAMCKLSCSICDKMEEQFNDGSKRRGKFRNIEQLKGHLFHRHKSFMCSLCLEGRKVFICEQRLYTRAQLNQHISTGDSEVDGSESERGGFMGHPMCEFCRTPFYGDNELYSHMSTEHYTCHICQRCTSVKRISYAKMRLALPKSLLSFNLKVKLRDIILLSMEGVCLVPSVMLLFRHIPTSFRYRRSNEQGHRRGRGQTFLRDSSENELSMAIQASLETANANNAVHDSSLPSGGQVAPDLRQESDIDPIIQPFETLAATDSEASARYLQALGHSRNKRLEESAFPPLSNAPGSSSQLKPKHDSDGLPNNSMAAHLRRKGHHNVTVVNTGQAWAAASRGPVIPSSNSSQAWPAINAAPGISRGSSQNKTSIGNAPDSSSYASSAQVRPTTFHGLTSSSSKNSSNPGRISHSTSAPNLVENGSVEPSISDFPPVSAVQVRKLPSSSQALLNLEDVHTANKSLVEKIRAALEFDEDRYTIFKDISGQYRQGLLDTEIYLDYVWGFGLSHLVLDLARLCPDARKQKELLDTYNTSLRTNIEEGNDLADGNLRLKDGNRSKKGKGKCLDREGSNSKNTRPDSVRKLQLSYKPSEEEVEVLSKEGYRGSKGKTNLVIDEPQVELNSHSQPSIKLGSQKNSSAAGGESDKKVGDGGGGSKQRKKTSKFHRLRLGDGSALLDLNSSNSHPDPDLDNDKLDGSSNNAGGLPARGVWKNGAHRLFNS
ncbi:hypothetical protein FEM48_Zijuj09G0007700 [Ziziphus jujuba var. spinosa]|uniref:RING-type domain-containing protein n=1 Tax=Ziziphus jujuba var. spinosa TaxID=714518 RepID=A0A978UPX8_ZIZJJ|nr:hypothetical protein FEM48_Zijuj09G0007700 [Ziziphus jujuba var. spinosa]